MVPPRKLWIFVAMGRTHRPRLPGVLFHVTSRLQARAPHFVGLEATVSRMIAEALVRGDSRVVAYAVMPNHLHLILQQGSRPIGSYMQALLRRIALLLQRERGCEGHVVERRFHERACVTAEYARNAIAYVHLNAVRAGISQQPDSYPWCSHAGFCCARALDERSQCAVEDALRLFGAHIDDSLSSCAHNYRRFLKWRTEMDRWSEQTHGCAFHAPPMPQLAGGDEHWCTAYAPFVRAEVEGRRATPRRMDLRDLARVAVRQIDPELTVEDLRNGGSTRVLVTARRLVIQRASAIGFNGRTIATFLGVSQATVSAALKST